MHMDRLYKWVTYNAYIGPQDLVGVLRPALHLVDASARLKVIQ